MEAISSRYRLLAAIHLYHHFFLDFRDKVWGTGDQSPEIQARRRNEYRVADWLRVEAIERAPYGRPADYGLVVKPTPTGFEVIAEVDADRRSRVNIRDVRFGFGLRLVAQYASVTALPRLPPGFEYLFSNEHARQQGATFPSLAVPYQAHSTLRKYVPGTLVRQGTNGFMARLAEQNIDKPTTDAAFWRPLDDRLPFAGSGNEFPGNSGLGILGRVELVCRADLGDYSLIRNDPDPDDPAKTVNPTVLSKQFEVHLATFDIQSELQNL